MDLVTIDLSTGLLSVTVVPDVGDGPLIQLLHSLKNPVKLIH